MTSRKLAQITKENGLKMSASRVPLEPKLLRDYEVPPALRQKFVLSSYRPLNLSAWEYFTSVFHRNNETFNFWSHFLAAVLLIARYCSVVWNHNPLSDHFYFPLTSFTLGCCSVYLVSSTAHMFNSMSERACHICFYFDYAAISVYTFTSEQAFYFYCHPLNSGLILFDSRELYLVIGALLSFTATFLSCVSRQRWFKVQFILRTVSYLIPWLFVSSPFVTRQLYCDTEPACNPESMYYFTPFLLMFATAAVANMAQVPERFNAGAFDFCGNSHNILHVTTALGDHFGFSLFQSDLIARKEVLAKVEIPTFNETVGLTLLVLLGNVAIALWFAKTLRLNSDTAQEQHRKLS